MDGSKLNICRFPASRINVKTFFVLYKFAGIILQYFLHTLVMTRQGRCENYLHIFVCGAHGDEFDLLNKLITTMIMIKTSIKLKEYTAAKKHRKTCYWKVFMPLLPKFLLIFNSRECVVRELNEAIRKSDKILRFEFLYIFIDRVDY